LDVPTFEKLKDWAILNVVLQESPQPRIESPAVAGMISKADLQAEIKKAIDDRLPMPFFVTNLLPLNPFLQMYLHGAESRTVFSLDQSLEKIS
jgi:hypothetical protein